MKRRGLIAAAAALMLLLSGCTSLQRRYEQAQLCLGGGDYRSAAEMFGALGGYEDAAEYALYCEGLAALAEGEAELARADLRQVAPLASSERYLRYIDGLELAGEDKLTEALAVFEALGSFADSRTQAERLRERRIDRALQQAQGLMTAGDFSAAAELLTPLQGAAGADLLLDMCRRRAAEASYAAAEQLVRAGDLAGAAAAFDALGEALDAAQRARQCRETLYAMAEEAYRQITLASATDLMADYAALGAFRQSRERGEALEARFGAALRLMACAETHPYVQAGTYRGEPVTWRVLAVQGSTATLLADRVLEAAASSKAAEALTLELNGTTLNCRLPGFAELGRMDEDIRRCGTAERAAELKDEEGLAPWWLEDVTPAGKRLLVRAGRLSVSAETDEAMRAGVRPAAEVPLEQLELTEGDGSREDPFR